MSQSRSIILGINDLPAEIEIGIQAEKDTLGGYLRVFGLIVVGLGIFVMLFGPDTVYYRLSEGISFSQRILLNPGPMISVGFLITCLGYGLEAHAKGRHALVVQEALAARIAITEEVIPTGFRLQIDPIGGKHFRVRLVEKSQAEIANAEHGIS
ncbi:MAG: hypothetical protein ACK4VV_04545 [Pseudomonas sp.]